jgi:hypothetical protein
MSNVSVQLELNHMFVASMPVSLHRVEELTGKSITFYNANVCSNDELLSIFKKVINRFELIKSLFSIRSIP